MIVQPFLRSALVLLGSASLASAATSLINLDINTGTSPTFSGAGALGSAGDLWTAKTPTAAGLTTTGLNWSDGTPSGISVAMDPNGKDPGNMNGVFDPGTGGNLMRDFAGLHTNTAANCTITLSGFTPNQSLATIVLYGMNGDGGGTNPNQNASFTIGATTKTTDASGAGEVNNNLVMDEDYVRFDNIQADGSGNLVIIWENPSGGSAWSSFNGLQVQIPEPSTALLGGLGMLVLLRRRR